MNALDRRLKAHAANLAASWDNDTGWGDDEEGADIFLFIAEGFVLTIYYVDHAKGWSWRITRGQTGFENARSEKHYPIDAVMPEAWRALAELIRSLRVLLGKDELIQ